jgi:UDP-glucuronate 4-epimerase
MNNILVTGSAGFIGSALCLKLLELGYKVIGVDNHNEYYPSSLKEDRLSRHLDHDHYTHFRLNIENKKEIEEIFNEHSFQAVVNLAAQVGVRYSIENPYAYLESNLMGFLNILEGCREHKIKDLIYASSSSVYGSNTNMPFSVDDNVDHPISFYAATKKSNELMAHTYSHLYGINTIGLRFFTVYGPWGRPDMALFKFANSIVRNQEINVFNQGNHKRDFTYIDDIIGGIIRIIEKQAMIEKSNAFANQDGQVKDGLYKIYNIGCGNPVELGRYIMILEQALETEAKKKFLPMQPGDMLETYADITDLVKDFDYYPKTSVEDGVRNFADWFLKYYETNPDLEGY